METSYTILLQIIKMFLMIIVGYYLYKKKLIVSEQMSGISNLLLFVATPGVLINSFLQEYVPDKIPNLLFSFIVSFIIYIVGILIAEKLYKKDDGIDKFGVVFSNAGFIGIPLVGGVFGSEAIFYLAPFVGMFYVFVWTYGIWIMCYSKKEISIKKILLNPSIIALILGIALFSLKVKLPSPVTGAKSSFAGLNTPLAMIILGCHVTRGNLKDIFTNIKAYKVSILRLIIIPLIIVGLLAFIPAKWNEVNIYC